MLYSRCILKIRLHCLDAYWFYNIRNYSRSDRLLKPPYFHLPAEKSANVCEMLLETYNIFGQKWAIKF